MNRYPSLAIAGCTIGLLLSISSCAKPAPAATAIPSTQTSTYTPTITPTKTPTPDPYATWSTNFSYVSSPSAAGIEEWTGGQLSIDSTNVNSGGKSIKDSETIDYSRMLQTVFSIQSLIGRNVFDLSDKTLSLEVYLPGDAPFSVLYIQLMSGNNNLLVRENIPPQKGRWYTYTVDLSMVIALGSWQYADWMHSPGISTQANAVNLLKNVERIMIGGSSFSANSAPAFFLIDKLGWQPSGPLPSYDPAGDSLRKYADAKNMLMGTFLEVSSSSDPQYLRSFFQEFNTVSEIAVGNWPATEPAGDNFDAAVQDPSDIFMENIAERLGSPPVRYAGTVIPGWLLAKSTDERKIILEDYIRAEVGYHKGKTKIWYLFNELIGSPMLSDSPSDISLIEDAFREARETDPAALLFINDGGVEEMGQPKADTYYQLVAELVSNGTPIDGIGLQTHLLIGQNGKVYSRGSSSQQNPIAFTPTDGLANVAKNVERYQALGLKVAFTEVDVSIYIADIDSSPAGQQRLAQRLQVQADVYKSLMHIAITHPKVIAFISQAWADQYSWITVSPLGDDYKYGDSGFFDADWQPKPAYYALLDELKS